MQDCHRPIHIAGTPGRHVHLLVRTHCRPGSDASTCGRLNDVNKRCRIPLYAELKIGLVYFLACANGTEYVYERFLMPFLTQHQALIDQKVDIAKGYVQNHISANLSWCDMCSGECLLENTDDH